MLLISCRNNAGQIIIYSVFIIDLLLTRLGFGFGREKTASYQVELVLHRVNEVNSFFWIILVGVRILSFKKT